MQKRSKKPQPFLEDALIAKHFKDSGIVSNTSMLSSLLKTKKAVIKYLVIHCPRSQTAAKSLKKTSSSHCHSTVG